ncbi:beaten path Ia [Carabus blaptoides fortunei]
MPFAVQRGEPALFICHYDLEGDALYSVKWYKGRREFYRFTPREIPSEKIFPIPNLDVDTKRSNGSHLSLGPVDPSVSGRYSCEVSADAPSFHTALVSGETNVVEIPHHTPTISGVKPKYRLGDSLRGNCTSKHSNPAANLTWYINDRPANSKYVKLLKSYSLDNGLSTSQIGLRFTVNKHHFEHGRLKIRCLASIYTVYWKSTEKSVDEERPKLSSINDVTPNTLGVNQLPSPYDIYSQSKSYFDEDFPVEHRHSANSITYAKPDPPPDDSSSTSSSYVHSWSTPSVLLCAWYATQTL